MTIELETEQHARIGVAAAGSVGARVAGKLAGRLPVLEPLSYAAPGVAWDPPPVDMAIVVSGMEDESVARDTLRAAALSRGLTSMRLCMAVVPQSSFPPTQEVQESLQELRQLVQALFLVSHRDLKPLYPHAPGVMTDSALEEFLIGSMLEDFTRLTTERSLICIDFADVLAILGDGSSDACLGVGLAGGEGGAALAAEKAIQSLREQGMDPGRHGAFLACLKGSTNITMDDFDDAARVIHESIHPDANVIVGLLLDDDLGANVRVLIMAKRDAVPVAQVAEEWVTRFMDEG